MRISSSSPSAQRAACGALAALLSLMVCPQAHAFGGFWSAPGSAVEQSAQQIIFVDNPDATVTAIIRLRYAGPAQSFAWVIPVRGKPTVGVSSNAVFQRLAAATAPEYWLERAVQGTCMEPEDPGTAPDGGAPPDAGPSQPYAPGPIVVLEQGTVGPYDYAEVLVDAQRSDAAQVATEWLELNGYAPTGLESELLSPYLDDGFNLLAFKLRKDLDAGVIRPVVLTYESELPVIPIRPAAVAAQDDVGLQVWVFGPSQAVPANYKSLVINDALIDWLSAKAFPAGTLPAGGVGPSGPPVPRPSNYDALVSAAADEAGGRGFVTELGGPASQYRDKVWSVLDQEQVTAIFGQSYEDGFDVVVAAHAAYRAWDGWKDAVEGAVTLPEGVTFDELDEDPERYRGVAQVDTDRFLELLDQHVVEPVSDVAALFANAPYLTRLYTTMSADELTVDPSFDYNFDLAQVSNVHVAKQRIECEPTLSEREAPWRIELPQGGVVVGSGGDGWPVAAGTLPANLKVV
ncbi:MAG TPA: DUF2330 domain-containing protein, partial [Polyangiales bacterium]|nr:DUF2330 domain-containing protein [Polyangiales bacterium]